MTRPSDPTRTGVTPQVTGDARGDSPRRRARTVEHLHVGPGGRHGHEATADTHSLPSVSLCHSPRKLPTILHRRRGWWSIWVERGPGGGGPTVGAALAISGGAPGLGPPRPSRLHHTRGSLGGRVWVKQVGLKSPVLPPSIRPSKVRPLLTP